VRANSIKLVRGTAQAAPVAPTLINNSAVHQYPLAYISVPVGTTQIVQGLITQMVGTVNCPFITGPLTTLNLANQFAVWDAQFANWFNSIENQLTNHDYSTVLLQSIEAAGVADEFNFTDIPAGYNKLRLVGVLKQDFTVNQYGATPILIRINNDSGSNYGRFDANGFWTDSTDTLVGANIVGNKTEDAGVVSVFDLELPKYDANNIYKWSLLKVLQGNYTGVIGNPNGGLEETFQLWKSLNPVTRIQVFGTFVPVISKLQLFGCPV
jgi:hypothetical protein